MTSRGQGRSETSRLVSMYHTTPGTYIDTFYRGEKRQSEDSDGDPVLGKVVGEGLSGAVTKGGNHVEVWNIPGKEMDCREMKYLLTWV